ncbi:hypothetical protein PHMEG_00036637, partial [Phytophthora megakarya]
NNMLFPQDVIENAKEEIRVMPVVRYLLSGMNFCPRHRAVGFNRFCRAFELQKVVSVPCSWKAEPLSIFVYKSTHNE